MKPVTSTLLFLLLLICRLPTYGQGENNVWCFGFNRGLDFNAGPPSLFTNGINTWEGCASVSDATGNLLFYASPERVWDRNNNVMPNGSGLLGGKSATQGAAIVRSYSNPDQYYLFYLTEGEDITQANPGHLYYSVVDMTLNGGFGDIVPVQKNIILDAGTTEKMIVIKGNGCFSWLVVHENSEPVFHAFKIDASGIDPVPVVSNSGFYWGLNKYLSGEMKVSPNNANIAVASGQNKTIEAHSFNNAAGVVYDAIRLDSNILGSGNYGLEYSPDGSKLYIGTYGGFATGILQYDVSLLPDTVAVRNSKTVLYASDDIYGIRRGPDGKLYASTGGIGEYVSVVNNPNLAGVACNFVPNIFGPFPAGHFYLNLGNIFVPTLTDGGTSSTDTNICTVNGILTLSAPTGDTYLWSDGTTLQSDTFSGPGTKWVTSTSNCVVRRDTFNVTQSPVDTTFLSTDTLLCFAGNNIPLVSAPAGYTTYLWSDGITAQTDTASQPGTKWVRSQTGCDMRVDTFHMQALPVVITSFVKDTSICMVNNVPLLSALAGYNSYLWSDGKTTQQDTTSQAGTKWVRAQTGCSMRVDTFHVHDRRDTTIIVTDTTHCVAYSPIGITAPGGYTSYLWSDGKTTQVDTFVATTTKWVIGLNGCDMLIDTVHFTANTIPNDSITMYGGDTTLCFENVMAVNIAAPGGYTYYLWSDGSQQQTNSFAGPGTKWVYAQQLCRLLIDTFSVFAQGTDTTTNLIDTFVCFANSATINAPSGYLSYLWSDGTTTQSNTFSSNEIKYVAMHRACEQTIDTFDVQFVNGLSVVLGQDTSLCKGEVIHLNAATTYPGAVYQWQDNSNVPNYDATESGDYIVKVSVGPCSVSDTVRIHQEVINANLGKGIVPCGAEEIILDPKVDADNYLWQDGSTNRTFKATKAGNYSVKVTDGLCTTTAKVTVAFESCPCVVVIPSGFSPNNDSKNDKFGPTISCDVSGYKFMVYNRWGGRVFYTENVNDKWDGTVKGVPVDGDVFNYYLEFKDREKKVYYYKGDVTLVR